MSDSRIKDTLLAISTAPEAAYNTMPVLASLYTALTTRSEGLPLPIQEKFDDADVIGTQSEGASEQTSGFLEAPTWEVTGDVNTGTFATQARRALGKADPVPAAGDIIEAGVAFMHRFALLTNFTAAGLQLPSSTFMYSNNGADFLYGGGVANVLTVGQQGAPAHPTFSLGYVGSGKYMDISAISGPAFGSLALPTAQSKLLGPESQVDFNDGSARTLASAHRLRNINCTVVNNNLDTGDRRAGASPLDVTNLHKGWILDYLLHGDRSSAVELTVMLDGTMAEHAAATNDTVITSFTYRMRGHLIGASVTNRHMVEVVFGKSYFRATRLGSEGGWVVMNITVFPVNDLTAAVPNWVKMNVQNGVATAMA